MKYLHLCTLFAAYLSILSIFAVYFAITGAMAWELLRGLCVTYIDDWFLVSAVYDQGGRVRDYEIAIKSVELAEKWRDLMDLIERRFRDAYNRLGQLAEKLQNLIISGREMKPQYLLPIANEAYGIWKFLTENIPNFNPYYQRLQADEFQRLSRVVIHAKAGKVKTVFNDIEEATAKLEAVAIGEGVTRAELKKKAVFFSG